jgi:MFS family permease
MTKEEKKVNKHWWRWLILLVVSLVMFGSYYIYDVLSPINEFIQQDMGIDNAKFGLLFSSYYIVNLLFVLLIAGFILDRFGIRKAGTFYVYCSDRSLLRLVPENRSPSCLSGECSLELDLRQRSW